MNQKHTKKKLFHLPVRYLLTSVAIIMLFLCSEVSANASARDVHEVASLCMQANRILKDYALIGMGVEYHNPKEDLEKNIKMMDEEFKVLKSHKLNEKLSAEIVEIETSWNALKPEFQKNPDKTKMSDLRKMVEKYTDRCEEVAEDLSKDSGIKGEHDVVLVAELGMESQRLAALYMMKAWGVADSDYESELKQVVDQTEKIYKELLEADEKLVSKEIKKQIKSTEKAFIAFSVMAQSTSGRFMPSAAAKMANKIFKKLTEILQMEQKFVEGSISGYFMPIADEKNAGEIFKVISEVEIIKGEIGS